MSGSVLSLCERARSELACLGELGRPLLEVLRVVERVGGARDVAALADPVFALDVLAAADSGAGEVVGRLLDFFRARAGAGPVEVSGSRVTLQEAVEAYEAGALALMARGTQHTYRTWTRRLVDFYGDREPARVTAGDLTDLIARHVVAARRGDERRRVGRSAEENAVAAFRHLWGYLVERGYAEGNVAARLRKPSRGEPRRRAIRVD